MKKQNIQGLRHDYTKFKIDKKSINKNPFEQFKIWFDQAVESEIFTDPNAFILSTAGRDCRPSSRVVLLKNYSDDGFIFYTNYESRKGIEISENPYVSLIFFWDKFERQVRIGGSIEKISPEESDKYFQSRPYTSRLGAWASKQSAPLKSRFSLMRKVASLMVKYPAKVPLPPFWGGYVVKPDEFEFWQGRESRLHDRFRYTLEHDKWEINRLNP